MECEPQIRNADRRGFAAASAVVVAALVLAFAAGARGQSFSLDKPCYREGDPVQAVGHGFLGNKMVDIKVVGDTQYAAVTDGAGDFTAVFPAPSITYLFPPEPQREHVPLRIEEHPVVAEPPGRSTVGWILVTTLAATTSPPLPVFGDIPKRVRFRLSGFASGAQVYGHWRLGGRPRGTDRLGIATGTCGALRSARQAFRSRLGSTGSWVIQFDQSRGYSPSTSPQARISFSIVRTASSAQSGRLARAARG